MDDSFTPILLALVMGAVAGSRSMLAPAAVTDQLPFTPSRTVPS